MATAVTTLPFTMHIQQNLLRLVRKRTELTQVDIASILDITDFANISRWEAGLKSPGVEILLAYHLLFDTPIDAIFERQKKGVLEKIIPKIKDRLDYLEALPQDAKVQCRIQSLGSILSRLTS